MTAKVKSWVSKQKKRYQQDGFDLDLSYICDNVIAMGFPGEKIEGFYRNNIDEVHKFLEAKHHGKYRIYNLCSERSYDPQKFKGSVVNYPFKDHNPPSLCVIPEFCKDVEEWLKIPGNVAVVHCKAGKGRTGVMICCYLLHSKLVSTARSALEHYAQKRTHDLKGVTIPSQQRYVQYYEHILRTPDLELPLVISRRVLLHEFTLEGSLNLTGSTATIYIHITQAGPEDGSYSSYTSGHGGIQWKTCEPLTISLEQPLRLLGDIKVEIYVKHLMTKQRLCHFWFNTYFIDIESPSSNNLMVESGAKVKERAHSPSGGGPATANTSNNNRTKVRFVSQETRNSSDNVTSREPTIERTMSCPPPHHQQNQTLGLGLPRPQLPGEWIRFTDTFDDDLEKSAPIPSIHLTFPRSQLDKINKKLFTSSTSCFRVTLGFSQYDHSSSDSGPIGGPAAISPRCFRSNSDHTTTTTSSTHHPSSSPRFSSSSSSSSTSSNSSTSGGSCTDDDHEHDSEGSVDSSTRQPPKTHHHHHRHRVQEVVSKIFKI